MFTMQTPSNDKHSVLHICRREMLRPLRDQILRISGFEVDSTLNHAEGLSLFWQRSYDLVLIDVEGTANAALTLAVAYADAVIVPATG